jgi:hypothetical protein
VKKQPRNLIPRYVSVGFGGDSGVCVILSNSGAKIINGPPAEERELPLMDGGRIVSCPDVPRRS